MPSLTARIRASSACRCSYFGFIYFLYMFALAVRLVFEPYTQSLRLRAILYAAMGAISSMYFIYLQLRFIRELCSYCLIAAVVSVFLVVAALSHFQHTRHPRSGNHP